MLAAAVMNTPHAHALAPELARLVEAGVLARAADLDAPAAPARAPELVAEAARRGEVTREQAAHVARLLGLVLAAA